MNGAQHRSTSGPVLCVFLWQQHFPMHHKLVKTANIKLYSKLRKSAMETLEMHHEHNKNKRPKNWKHCKLWTRQIASSGAPNMWMSLSMRSSWLHCHRLTEAFEGFVLLISRAWHGICSLCKIANAHVIMKARVTQQSESHELLLTPAACVGCCLFNKRNRLWTF